MLFLVIFVLKYHCLFPWCCEKCSSFPQSEQGSLKIFHGRQATAVELQTYRTQPANSASSEDHDLLSWVLPQFRYLVDFMVPFLFVAECVHLTNLWPPLLKYLHFHVTVYFKRGLSTNLISAYKDSTKMVFYFNLNNKMVKKKRYQGWKCLKCRKNKQKVQFKFFANLKNPCTPKQVSCTQKISCTPKKISCTLVYTSVHREDHWFNSSLKNMYWINV